MPNKADQRYSMPAIILHWSLALAFLLMLASGLLLHDLPRDIRFTTIQLHKSLGVIILLAVTARLILRLIKTPPPLPDTLSKQDKILAKLGHLALYGAMIIIPVSGWVMVSSSPYGLPTLVFNSFEWPHIPWVEGDKEINQLAKTVHEIIAYVFIGLIVVHVAAVIKHAVKDRLNLLPRMGIGRLDSKQ